MSHARFIFLITLVLWNGQAVQAAPLHERIDALIDAKAGGPVAGPATDAEFLRRIYLDFNGTIPTAAEARAFSADSAADKRAKLIDRLLANPNYPRRMAEAFDVMLMERRTKDDPASQAWRAYLQASFAANESWDRISQTILSPNADDEAKRAAALFYVRRLEKVGANPTDYPGLTRDLGRLFMGVDLKCAQCHNHRTIDAYKQADWQGLFAFVGQTFIRTDVKFPAIGEKPLEKKIEYVSVFKPDEKRQVGPRIPFGAESEVPAAVKGQEWATPPDKATKFPGTPKFSVVKLLSEKVATAENDLFKRNIANRLWFLMMGRGLVHPLDLSHDENPPSHPELLELLADEFVAMKFDVKAMLRELAMTRVYQRSSVMAPAGANVTPQSYRVAISKGLSAEQAARGWLTATGELETVLAAKEEAPKPKAVDPNEDVADADDKVPAAKGGVSLREINKKFVAALAGPAAEPEVEFAPSVSGALFFSNDKTLADWLKPRAGNLVGRALKMDDAAAAEEIYLSILTRLPDADERADALAHLKKHAPRRDAALGDLAWALLASTEFCLNH